MKKQELLKRLCGLTTLVMNEKFHFKQSADCFCGMNRLDHQVTSDAVVEFIEAAVAKALLKDNT